MTVLVIAYKRGLNDSVELRYSLRSLEKNLHMPDLEVVIAGDTPPSWLKADAHVPVEVDLSLGKAGNISRAVWHASRQLSLDGVDTAVYLDDDYFLLDPTNSVMLTHGGPLDAHLGRCIRNLSKGHWFTESMSATYRALMAEGPQPVTFELHRPLPFVVDEAVEQLEAIQGTEVFWRSWYGNMSNADLAAVEAQDGRYVGKSLPAGIPWVSSEDRAWSEWLGKKISGMFPEKSRWER